MATSPVVATPTLLALTVPSVLFVREPLLIDTFTVSPVALVDIKSLSPATLKDNPPDLLSACAVVDVESAVNLNELLPRPFTRLFTSPTVAALESLPNPLPTLVIALFPALIPVVVTDGPPEIVKPLVFIVVLPTLILLPETSPFVPFKAI